jgi:uncharacterized membrane protein
MEDLHNPPRIANPLDRLISYLTSRWLLIFGIGFGALVILPFFAPWLMKVGLTGPARLIYSLYSLLCHQLPERSFFLFGSQIMYSLEELQEAGADMTHLYTLRRFIGSPELGWKVAWSDRMVWMYTSMWLFWMLWRPYLKKLKRLPWWGLLLFLLPMAVDGTSHLISDLAGIGQGFRAENLWLVGLTGYAFSASFYAGDALGSFNFLMRLVTGLLFGLGVIWFLFPYLEEAMSENARLSNQRISLPQGNPTVKGLPHHDYD